MANDHRTAPGGAIPINRLRIPPLVSKNTRHLKPRIRCSITAKMNKREVNHLCPSPRS
jgi:hypothetical protein